MNSTPGHDSTVAINKLVECLHHVVLEKAYDKNDWRRLIELAAKSLLILWNLILFVGAVVIFVYCLLVAGRVPSVKLDSIISTIFSVSLVGIMLMTALVVMIVGPSWLWRMANQALLREKGTAAQVLELSNASGAPESVPQEAGTQRESKLPSPPCAWEFLIVQVMTDIFLILSIFDVLPTDIAAYSIVGVTMLLLFPNKPYVLLPLWRANLKWDVKFADWTLRFLALISSIAPVMTVLTLLDLQAEWSFIIVGALFQIYYVIFISTLAAPKENRRQDLIFWGSGIVLTTILLLAPRASNWRPQYSGIPDWAI